MQRRLFILRIFASLVWLNVGMGGSLIEAHSGASVNSAGAQDTANSQTSAGSAQTAPSPRSMAEVIERVFKREKEEMEIIAGYSPIVETYIQTVTSNPVMGVVPKSDDYFLGQADFHGKSMKVHSMLEKTHKLNIMWLFNPVGFLQMAFLDFGQFDHDHYKLTYRGRVFLGTVRCLLFDVEPIPQSHGFRFFGRIWVEDQDFTIVRMNGRYLPEIRFSPKHFDDEFYFSFDSWRTNVKYGDWLPYEIYSQDLRDPTPTGGPRFKAKTHFWGYELSSQIGEQEFGRLLVESQSSVKDDSESQDRSPLDQQRDWRALSQKNVFEVLERSGLAAPEGDVERVLNTIVNNIMVTNRFDGRIEKSCRVLLTSNLEMFSVQNTIVLSRGLIDVVPNEETLAAFLAYELADSMVPKPAQDQYGFSDILRLKPTEAMRKLSFLDTPEEARRSAERALELLRKSPYADKLPNIGLFFAQLQSQLRALKQLVNPRLGNRVFFTAQLLQSAPALQPENLEQLSALPMDSRIKINPWSDTVSLMKTNQMGPLSPREKIPFEITPISLYLMRYTESSANVEHTIVPRSAMPVAEMFGQKETLRAKN